MKNTIYLLFVVCLCIYFSGCNTDMEQISGITENKSVINGMQEWYNENYSDGIIIRSVLNPETIVYAVEPDWENVEFRTTDENYIAEVCMKNNGIFGYLDERCLDLYKETGEIKYLQSSVRLIVTKGRETTAEIITLIPDYTFLLNSDFQPFADFSFTNPIHNFSGKVIYYDKKGNFLEGWGYENGKKVYSFEFTNEPVSHETKNTLADEFCWDDMYFEWVNECQPIFDSSGNFVEQRCIDVESFFGYIRKCGDPSSSVSLSRFYEKVLHVSLDEEARLQFDKELLTVADREGYKEMFRMAVFTSHNFLIIDDIVKWEGQRGVMRYNYFDIDTDRIIYDPNNGIFNVSLAIIQLFQESIYQWAYQNWRNPGYPKKFNTFFEGPLIADILDYMQYKRAEYNMAYAQFGTKFCYDGVYYSNWLIDITNNCTQYPGNSELYKIYGIQSYNTNIDGMWTIFFKPYMMDINNSDIRYDIENYIDDPGYEYRALHRILQAFPKY